MYNSVHCGHFNQKRVEGMRVGKIEFFVDCVL